MPTAEVQCTKCGKHFNIPTNYFQRYGEQPFCDDCLVHTQCQNCGKGLRLQPSKYREVGGEPVVCTTCAPDGGSSNGGKWFWHGLTNGEKVIFPILVVLFIGALSLAAAAEMSGGEAGGFALTGLLVLILWTYSRGRRNAGA